MFGVSARPSSPTTISNLDIQFHERFAHDQATVDSRYVTDSSNVSHHFDAVGMSAIYRSEWTQLFGLHETVLSWASFSSPPGYAMQRRRFFAHQILTRFVWIEDEEESQQESEAELSEKIEQLKEAERQMRVRCKDLLSRLLARQHSSRTQGIHFEKERTQLLELIRIVRSLNSMLAFVRGRRLQYQKG